MGRRTGCTETGVDRRVDGILRAIGYQRFVLTHYCPRRRAESEQGRINLGALEMTTSSGIKHVYDPDTLSIMTDAFDRACDFLPVQFRDSDHMRRKLASHIVRHVNDGESDPTRLAEAAILFVLR
jgi:hypothetical protein